MVPRKNMEPSEGAILLSGMKFSNLVMPTTMSMTKPCVLVMPLTLVPFVWSCLTIGVTQERTKACHANLRGHDHHYNHQNRPVFFRERECEASMAALLCLDPQDGRLCQQHASKSIFPSSHEKCYSQEHFMAMEGFSA